MSESKRRCRLTVDMCESRRLVLTRYIRFVVLEGSVNDNTAKSSCHLTFIAVILIDDVGRYVHRGLLLNSHFT